MAPIVLYSGPLSMFGAKAEIALREKGVPFELVMVPFAAGDRYDPVHPEVMRINPKRQVPVLAHDGLEIFDSTLIFEYLEDAFPEPALWPKDAVPRTPAAPRLMRRPALAEPERTAMSAALWRRHVENANACLGLDPQSPEMTATRMTRRLTLWRTRADQAAPPASRRCAVASAMAQAFETLRLLIAPGRSMRASTSQH